MVMPGPKLTPAVFPALVGAKAPAMKRSLPLTRQTGYPKVFVTTPPKLSNSRQQPVLAVLIVRFLGAPPCGVAARPGGDAMSDRRIRRCPNRDGNGRRAQHAHHLDRLRSGSGPGSPLRNPPSAPGGLLLPVSGLEASTHSLVRASQVDGWAPIEADVTAPAGNDSEAVRAGVALVGH
jgi:hypothetical protein